MNITNVLPGYPYLTPTGSLPLLTIVLDISSALLTITRLDIPSNRDKVVVDEAQP